MRAGPSWRQGAPACNRAVNTKGEAMETKTQHTSEPWVFDNREYGDLGFAVNARKGAEWHTVAIACADYLPRAEAAANARLVAAAPDLLDHLTRMVNIATHPQATKAQIRQIAADALAAIAKAEGR